MTRTASRASVLIATMLALGIALLGASFAFAGQAHAATPGKPKITSVKSDAPGQLTVKVKKAKGAKGYQYLVSQSKKFKGKTTKKAKAKKTSRTIKGLTSGKTYWVKVRAYDKKGKFGKWSRTKKAVVKPEATKPDLAYIYVDTGRRSSQTTKWDEASQSYLGLKLYELYVDEEANAPSMGSSYRGGLVTNVANKVLSELPAGSVTLLTRVDYNSVSLPAYNECTSIDLSKADTSHVTSLTMEFCGCQELTSINLSGWDTSNVTDMSDMFWVCPKLTSLNLSGWNTSKVTKIDWMFSGCNSLTSLDISGWDLSGLQSSPQMMWGSLVYLKATGLKLPRYCYGFFDGLSNLVEIEGLESWDTLKTTDMRRMFRDCSSLKTLDMSKWNISNVTDMDEMLDGCSSLNQLKTGATWKYNALKSSKPIFPKKLFDESGAEYSNVSYIPEGAHTYTATKPAGLTGASMGL